ncbi:MAG TPA: hypothetical protein VME41_02175 [Stellaceae bacterium]|nr:hypothetical protein [Stellaceae bacterium]
MLPWLAPAVAIYLLFHFLDGKASAPAKRAINAWINYQDYNDIDLKTALVAAFDNIYTAPLFRFRALTRSITVSVFTICIVATALIGMKGALNTIFFVTIIAARGASLFRFFMLPYFGNIFSDYVSLFLVRFLLRTLHQDRPLWAILLSAAAGSFVVGGVFIFLNMVTIVGALALVFHKPALWLWPIVDPVGLFYIGSALFKAGIFQEPSSLCLIAALMVHLWLALFAFGAISLRGLQSIFRFTRTMQWFLERGDDHPIEAIGLVAALITCCMTVVFHLFQLD